jgi:hypothetical protein
MFEIIRGIKYFYLFVPRFFVKTQMMICGISDGKHRLTVRYGNTMKKEAACPYETMSHICSATLSDNSQNNSFHRLKSEKLKSHEGKVQISEKNGRLKSLFFRTPLR